MFINENEFPVVVQAYQPSGTQERFVAEQVVNSQTEIDSFTSRYAGFLIKARRPTGSEVVDTPVAAERRPARSSGAAWIIILLLIGLIVAGFATGWIQRTFHLNF